MSILVNPHSWGDPLGMVANLHLAAAIANTSYFEFPHDPPAFPTERLPVDAEDAGRR